MALCATWRRVRGFAYVLPRTESEPETRVTQKPRCWPLTNLHTKFCILALKLPYKAMNIFTRKKDLDIQEPDEAPAVSAAVDGVKDFDPAMFDDPAAMRRFVLSRLYVESQTAPTAGARIAALKEIAALNLVTEETKYRVQNKGETIVNIVSVRSMLESARDRTRIEAATLELPPSETQNG